MAASQRIKATNILFKIDGTEYNCDANMVELTLNDAPGDVQTFCEVSAGKEWKMQIDGITSGEDTSLYRILWDNFGDSASFVIAPNGNSSPSSDAPHYKGTVVFDDMPPLSLTANETAKFSVTLTVAPGTHSPATGYYWGVQLDTTP